MSWPHLFPRQSPGGFPPGDFSGDRTPVLLGVLITGVILNVVSVALRLWARRSRRVALQWDDWFMIMDMIVNLGVWGLLFAMIRMGLGKHAIFFNPEILTDYLKILYSLSILYLTGLTLVKLSILFLYLRIFPQPGFQRMVWLTIGLVVIYGIGSVFIAANFCFPFDHLWNANVCFDLVKIAYVNTTLNTALDILIFALPIPLLWKLQVPKGRKAALISIFLAGLGVCLLSVIRIPYIQNLDDQDFTYVPVTYIIFEDCEIILSVCCANFSVAYPVIAKSLQRIYATVSTQKNSSSGTQNSQPVPVNSGGSRSSRLNSNNKEWHELRDNNSDTSNTPQWQAGGQPGVKNTATYSASQARGDDESGDGDGIKVQTNIDWQSVKNV
ncbi:MAG: hypothetical protein M1829_003022 [Trizodia sp. TS-e1964]|nr:MAG: hypothetical protein M1829_003022 [Trizodia sp. TS-e1964]